MLSQAQASFFIRSTMDDEQALLAEVDCRTFSQSSKEWVKNNSPELLCTQWDLFNEHLLKEQCSESEKLILLKAAFKAMKNPIRQGEFAQLLTLSSYVKRIYGLRLFRSLFTRPTLSGENSIRNYLEICQLLYDLQDVPGITLCVEDTLPNMALLVETLRTKHNEYLAAKFPKRSLDEVLSRFQKIDNIVKFPLSAAELQSLKEEYCKIEDCLPSLKTLTQQEIAALSKHPESKQQLIAAIIETVRRVFKVDPHDTQILSFLALINSGDDLKGRIAQIKTGEGKSLIIAMLAAYMACQGENVDIVTSSPYLAKFACETNKPFFEALGLTTTHICHKNQEAAHFSGNIVYGTNTDFEFAMLRDGLNHTKIRDRKYGTVIVDEADNFFIDLARNSARIAIEGEEDVEWVYHPILAFIKDEANFIKPSKDMVQEIRAVILRAVDKKFHEQIRAFTDKRLEQWLDSAKSAWYVKKENVSYIVKPVSTNGPQAEIEREIVIVDYENTGRLNEGSQWQHGLHQFLQAKHGLPIKSDSLTAAAIDHHSYFSLYKRIIGLTGTMGEESERHEIKTIYGLDSFDVPPYTPSKRITIPPKVLANEKEQFAAILGRIQEMQAAGRPSLILFKTIKDSDRFRDYLLENNFKPQLLNETQSEAEEYVLGRAGEAMTITIATNTAGRGTDIKLSPESKRAGGLDMCFGFYPKNKRVQEQGEGRPARQGDEGSCCMFLNEEAEDLRQYAHLSLTDGVKVALLDLQRTSRTELESKQRHDGAIKEGLIFEKLQLFFASTQSLHALLNNEEFKKEVIQSCESQKEEELDPDMPSHFDVNKWGDNVKDAVKSLLLNQSNGMDVDWSYFYDQFKEAYLSQVNKIWARSYTQLDDDLAEGDINEIKEKLDKAYSEVQEKLNHYLAAPSHNVHTCLKEFFHTAQIREEGRLVARCH